MSKFEYNQFTNTGWQYVDVLWNTNSACDTGIEFFPLNVYNTNNYFKDTEVLPKLIWTSGQFMAAY